MARPSAVTDTAKSIFLSLLIRAAYVNADLADRSNSISDINERPIIGTSTLTDEMTSIKVDIFNKSLARYLITGELT
jgi:hypothetical protein